MLAGWICCCLAVVGCAEPSSTSQTLRTFDPVKAPGRVAIWMESDGRAFRQKSEVLEKRVREVLTQEIAAKGWEVVPSMTAADYGLVYVYGLKSSEHAGYSVYGDSIMEDRMYLFYSKAELCRVGSDHRPKETVWNGSVFLGQYNVDFDHVFPVMAKALVRNEFPHK